MSSRDLLRNPIWRGEELGLPIPDSPHAVSVALPRWEDVVGYEEHRPEVLDRLQCGYPRFVLHPRVRELARYVGQGAPCLPFPSARVAEWASTFVQRASHEATRLCRDGVHAVLTSAAGLTPLQAFWQHTGLIMCSRQAEAILNGRRNGLDPIPIRESLRQQLAQFYDCRPEDVFLGPSGMAAQFAALQTAARRSPGAPTAQLGFPYVDTLKLQQKLGSACTFFHDLEHIATDLNQALERGKLAACFCEIPGNPLLGSADIRQITPLLRRHRVPLIADDVVATPFNVDLRPYADLIATSLTKYVLGTGDAMGGALICNPHSPLYAELKPLAQAQHEELLWGEEAALFEARAREFPERMRRHNQNGLLLAQRLRQHERVERVWYPKWEFSEAYEAVRRPDGRWGSLITILPKQAETRSARIYDSLAICKGPSLGTVFTLACPFTLLAHYRELDWAESCGVSRYLIRLSVGLEDPEDLWQRLDSALRVE